MTRESSRVSYQKVKISYVCAWCTVFKNIGKNQMSLRSLCIHVAFSCSFCRRGAGFGPCWECFRGLSFLHWKLIQTVSENCTLKYWTDASGGRNPELDQLHGEVELQWFLLGKRFSTLSCFYSNNLHGQNEMLIFSGHRHVIIFFYLLGVIKT